jgi:hypothetical protein
VVALDSQRCSQGLISDSLLAWRCFVLFGKRPWMKWLLTVMIAFDFGERLSYKTMCLADSELAGIGSLSNIALQGELRVHSNRDENEPLSHEAWLTAQHNDILNPQLIDVWAWVFFALNTTMTMSIIYKILCVGICLPFILPNGVVVCSSSRNRARVLTAGLRQDYHIYNTAMRAIIESSLVAWVGLVTYAIASTCFYQENVAVSTR